MDETAFELSSSRIVRRVAPRTYPRNARAVPPSNEHITSEACIGIDSAPVPPPITYQGAHLQGSWFKLREEGGGVCQLAITANPGWINNYVMIKLLEDAFDPFTRDIASGCCERRLLILDGAEPHTKVDFLEACWARNIVVILLLAKMSGRFQPLDVDFFNTLEAAYHGQMDAYQLGCCKGPAERTIGSKERENKRTLRTIGRLEDAAWCAERRLGGSIGILPVSDTAGRSRTPLVHAHRSSRAPPK